jgi:hypothetical protein
MSAIKPIELFMKQDSCKHAACLLVLPVALINGCASPQVDATVARTLQGYQVNRTTFEDFSGDAGLIRVERPNSAANAPRSYLNPQGSRPGSFFPGTPAPKTFTAYGIRQGGPWKIYETSEDVKILNGTEFRTSKFVVGSTNQPISILTFNGQGMLCDISPVPSLTPSR